MRRNHLSLIICLSLTFITLASFWQVQYCDFINLDDIPFIIENPHIQAGLNKKAIVWAFTTTYPDYWHPLTWLSHMLDYQLYGLNPSGYHFNNLLLHIANTLILFLCLNRMTGARWRSAFIAALFAFHPLHVESVAWVIERKDVLSTFFWMLSLWSYIRYVERPIMSKYLLILLFFLLGLLSKPMLVTFPFTLLLLDYWPLQRFKHLYIKDGRFIGLRPIWDKVPLIILATISSFATFFTAQSTSTVVSLNTLPIKFRIGNAFISYSSYIKKMLWPQDLAVFYPHPGHTLSISQVIVSGLLLIFISIWFIKSARSKPYLPVGWFWYLGTLIPVIGIIQVGALSMADRFTYIPLIGLFLIIAWGIPDLFKKWYYMKYVLIFCAGFALSLCIILTFFQVKYWKNSITLFEHAIEVNSNNYLAHYNLALASSKKGDFKKAIRHFDMTLRLRPDYASAHNEIGISLAGESRFKEAIEHHLKALLFDPENHTYHNNLGVTLAKHDKLEKAVSHYSEALRIKPDFITAHINLGLVFHQSRRFKKAITQYQNALEIESNHPKALFYIGLAYFSMGDHEAALKTYKILKSIDPNLAINLFAKISK
ncbi:MAG: tetratricopeptide repeat protein [Deltaproteobacteria bacterium]|nr:tetratricopeptide repeat protein [Deltaproteobacteria bacterium]